MEIKRFKKFLFEMKEMKKKFGDDYSLSEIKPGEKVKYAGGSYYVITSSEAVLELSKDPEASPGEKGNKMVNRAQFREKGAII